jgi:hypothetical protein
MLFIAQIINKKFVTPQVHTIHFTNDFLTWLRAICISYIINVLFLFVLHVCKHYEIRIKTPALKGQLEVSL